MRLLLLCLLCLIPADFAGGAPDDASRIKLFHGIAQGNYLVGNLAGAENAIQEMLRIDPAHGPAWTLKTRVLLDAGRPEAALDAARRALDLAPGDPGTRVLKALVLAKLDRRPEATKILEDVLRGADPGGREARAANRLLGLLRMADGEWDQAADAFRRLDHPDATESDLRLAGEAYLEKADSALLERDVDAAIAAVDEALALYQGREGEAAFRQRIDLRLLRARTHAQIGDFDAAVDDLLAVLGQRPDHLEARVTLAAIYAADRRWDALPGLLDPLREHPGLDDVRLYFEGRIALANDRVGTARAQFEAALDRAADPAAQRLRPTLRFYRALCLLRLERETEAAADLLDAIDAGFRPETSDEALAAAGMLLRFDRAAQAVPLLEAITLNRIDASAEAWAMLGRAHQAADNPALALSAFNASLDTRPDQAATRALRGALLRRIGDLDGAAADFEAACRLDPDNPAPAYALGLVRFRQGHLRRAADALARFVRHDADHPAALLIHALLAYATDDPEAAAASLGRYRALVPDDPHPSAIYLRYALDADDHPAEALARLDADAAGPDARAFLAYCRGQSSRKDTLDHAGIAHTPREARARICEAAFWMARHQHHAGSPAAARELLRIAVAAGQPEFPEYQLARWFLNAYDGR